MCADFSPIPSPLTLAGLESLRSTWCGQGMELFDDLVLVVVELGLSVEERGWCYHKYTDGDLVARYFLGEGVYLPDAKNEDKSIGRASYRERLRIRVGDACVARMYRTDDPGYPTQDSIFVPGAWVERMLARRPDARRLRDCRVAAIEDHRLAELARMMLIGKEV